MKEGFFDFMMEPSKESFLASRKYIVEHEDYDPYSDDLDELNLLLDQEKYKEASEFSALNLILSPRAHLLKNYALDKLQNEQGAKAEHILAMRIMECIELTGDGSQASSYIVTRISDEKDMLLYLGEAMLSQALQSFENKYFDVITTQSGKTIYFDITDCYTRLPYIFEKKKSSESKPDTNQKKSESSKKNWWKFW